MSHMMVDTLTVAKKFSEESTRSKEDRKTEQDRMSILLKEVYQIHVHVMNGLSHTLCYFQMFIS